MPCFFRRRSSPARSEVSFTRKPIFGCEGSRSARIPRRSNSSEVVGPMEATIARLRPFLTGSSSFVSRSEEHMSELQSQSNLVCRLLLEKKKKNYITLQRSLSHYLTSAVQQPSV